MTEDDVASAVLDSVGALLNKLPDASARRDAMEFLMMTGYNFMRQFGGDEYTLGWLESAVKDVKESSTKVQYRAPH